MSNKRAGTLFFKINGVQYDAAGEFTYNLGPDKKEGMVGPSGVAGFKALPQIPFVEGEIFDASGLDLKALQRIEQATVTLQLANGKTIVFHESWYAADGNVTTDMAKVQVKFECMRAEEI